MIVVNNFYGKETEWKTDMESHRIPVHPRKLQRCSHAGNRKMDTTPVRKHDLVQKIAHVVYL